MPEKTDPTDAAEPVPLNALAAGKAGALDSNDSVETAGERMRAHDTGQWPVTEGRKLVGVIDEKNPDWKMSGQGHDPHTWRVGQIMNRSFAFCYEDEDCAAARRVMDENGLRFLPVVDRQMRIVGIFSREELAEKAGAPGAEK